MTQTNSPAKQIAIVGAGLIGQAWAIVFARSGYGVRLWDGNKQALATAIKLIDKQLLELQQHQLIDNIDHALNSISTHDTLEEALEGVCYVQENLPEQIDLKQAIFTRLDKIAPAQTILASSTSSIPASRFTENLPGRERCLVAHPVNPPYLIPLVELCGAPWTGSSVISKTHEIMLDAGQKPIIVKGEPDGFILNRLQGALLREAFRLVEGGHVSVEDLDMTVKDGLGLRWAFMGPFETIDLNAPDGLADYCQRYGEMYRAMSERQTSTAPWPPELVAIIEQQRREQLPSTLLKARRHWRDNALMALAKHKQQHEESP